MTHEAHLFSRSFHTCGGWVGYGIIRGVNTTFHSIARNARRTRCECLHGILPPPPPISAESRVGGLYAAIRRIPEATLAANAFAAFSAHERHESGSSSRHERVFRALRSGFSGFRAPRRMVGSKFCQRSKSNGRLGPISAVGANRTVIWGQILPAEAIERSFGANFCRWSKSNGRLAPISASGANRTAFWPRRAAADTIEQSSDNTNRKRR